MKRSTSNQQRLAEQCRNLLRDMDSRIARRRQFFSKVNRAKSRKLGETLIPFGPFMDQVLDDDRQLRRLHGKVVPMFCRRDNHGQTWYSATAFYTPKLFSLWTKMVRKWETLLNIPASLSIVIASNNRKRPDRSQVDRASILSEFKILKPQVRLVWMRYRELLRGSDNIERSIKGARVFARAKLLPIYKQAKLPCVTGAAYWSEFEKIMRGTRGRIAPAVAAANLVCHRHKQPHLKSQLLSGNL